MSNGVWGRCPRCGSLLTSRTNRKLGISFLGCSKFPKCRFSKDLPEQERVRERHVEACCWEDNYYLGNDLDPGEF